jgi:curved DNA-binding protein CbpA
MSTLYDVLGVPPDAEDEIIRRTFRELAKAYHPDIHGDDKAEQSFKKMTAAYAVLKNPKTRAAYDARLALGRRLSRQRKHRDLLVCAVAAVASFSAVSSALLYRNPPASAYVSPGLEPERTDRLQTWQAELQKREAALPESPALPKPPASSQSPALSQPDRQTALPTGIAHLATPLPAFPARDPAPPAGTRLNLLDRAHIPTVDVRVWIRSADIGLNRSSRYVAKIFQVERERANGPSADGRLDLLTRPASGAREDTAGACGSSVFTACAALPDPLAR